MTQLLLLHREKTFALSKDEINTFTLQLFQKHCINSKEVISPTAADEQHLYGTSSSSAIAKKIKFDWSIDVESSYLPDSKSKLILCRKAFCFLYGISEYSIKAISKKMKDTNSSDIKSFKGEKMFDHHSYFGDEYSLEDIRAIFDANDLEIGVNEARAGLVRASNAHIDAMLWMEDYFYRLIFLKLKLFTAYNYLFISLLN
jgi:hypothetical protein